MFLYNWIAPPVDTHGKLIPEQTKRATMNPRLHTKSCFRRGKSALLGMAGLPGSGDMQEHRPGPAYDFSLGFDP